MSTRTQKPFNFPKHVAGLFRILGQPARLRVLLAIGNGEACVCHLEMALKMRQAYISQQLKTLREAGLVDARRDGRNIYYRLRDPGLLDVIFAAGDWLAGSHLNKEVYYRDSGDTLPGCTCPRCSGEDKPGLTIALKDITMSL